MDGYRGPTLSGKLTLEAAHNDGDVFDYRAIHNTITTAGLAALAALAVVDVGGTGWDYIAIGTSTATATALGGELASSGGTRRGGANVTGTRVTTDETNDTGQWTTTFTFTGSCSVTEAGIFDAAAAGSMLASQSFAALNVASSDTLAITWKVQMTA